jgi:hypothetical protein
VVLRNRGKRILLILLCITTTTTTTTDSYATRLRCFFNDTHTDARAHTHTHTFNPSHYKRHPSLTLLPTMAYTPNPLDRRLGGPQAVSAWSTTLARTQIPIIRTTSSHFTDWATLVYEMILEDDHECMNDKQLLCP